MKARPMTYAEYQEIVAMQGRINEIYGETKNSVIGAFVDVFADYMPELIEEHDSDVKDEEGGESWDKHCKFESRKVGI